MDFFTARFRQPIPRLGVPILRNGRPDYIFLPATSGPRGPAFMSTDTHHTMELPMKIPGGKKTIALYIGHHDPLDEAYYPKLMAAMRGMKLGKVSIVTIRHDDWCPKLTGGPCRCDADVVVEGED